MKKFGPTYSLIFCILIYCMPVRAAVDQLLPEYKPRPSLSGKIVAVGSDTMANLLYFWAEDFRQFYPSTQIEIHAEGSSTAPLALIKGIANIAPMSREMSSEEYKNFTREYGYPPTQLIVAIDALALFVHRENPIEKVNISELDSIFSAEPECSKLGKITLWQQLNVSNSLANSRLQLYGRTNLSGSSKFFRDKVMCSQPYAKYLKELPGSASVVQAISTDPLGIGMSGMGFKTAGVRSIPIETKLAGTVSATVENVLNGSYPLSRFLYIYVNQKPGQPLSPVVAEFIRLALSKSGQSTVEHDGYVALSAELVKQQLQRLNNAE